MNQLLQNKELMLIVVGVLIFWLRTQGGSPIVEKLIGIVRSVTNTPDNGLHVHGVEGRIACAKCVAEEFTKRGKTDVAKVITDAIPSLVDEGKPA